MLQQKQQRLVTNLKDMGYTLENPEEYKNLNSVLELTCSNGHAFSGSYTDLSTSDYECIECLKAQEIEITDTEGFLISFDAATVVTGYAIFNKAGQLLTTGKIEVDKKLTALERIEQMSNKISNLCKKTNAQIIAIEDIQMQHGNVSVFKTLAMLRGVILCKIALNPNYMVYSNIGASEWRKFNHLENFMREASKEGTRIKAKLIYQRDFEEDEADALFLGKCVYDMYKNKTNEIETQNLISFGNNLD